MFDFIQPQYYSWVFNYVMMALCLFTGIYYIGESGCKKLLTQNSGFWGLVLAVLLALLMGFRPVSGKYFGDTYLYAFGFSRTHSDFHQFMVNFSAEWFFDFVRIFCKQVFNDVSIWFLVIALFYVLTHTIACKKLLKENLWLASLFVFYSYSAWGYGINGIRNGMACGLMVLAIAYFADRNKFGIVVGVILSIFAMGCHRSVIIPIVAVFASFFFIKELRTSLFIWISCVILSIVIGGYLQNLIMGLGFDERMSSYNATSTENFSRSGFRWDFVLYSAMPIWLVWYVDSKGIKDKVFTLLANTYILANSIWVLVCRIAFSNRIAYLSWFLYALVIAYAVIRVPIWRNQDRKAGWILIAHTSFTFFMFLIGR